ncbi:MAG TPA: hypothetical protein DD856_10715 [Sulfobacillus sp.]|nr:hypothetical protein [Sulfobacillus sp.]
MDLRSLDRVAPLIAPLHARPFSVSDLNLTEPAGDSLAMSLWKTWLQWIPDADEEPLTPYIDWAINRHTNGPWAVVRLGKGARDYYLESVAHPPLDDLPIDPFPTQLYLVGFTSDWKSLLRSGGHFDSVQNWAEAILGVLSAWSDKYYTGNIGLMPTIWTIEGTRCALLT